MVKRRRAILPAILFLGIASVLGCATFPPPQPIHDVGSIAGDWIGQFRGRDGVIVPLTMAISRDGTYQVAAPSGTFTGMMTVSGGSVRARGDQTKRTGTVTLHEEPGGSRRLRIKNDDGTSSEWVPVPRR
jgi:hypothetical protein